MIVEDPIKVIYVPYLKDIAVTSNTELIKGNSKRAMASTNSNQFSSRLHAIFQITVEKRERAQLATRN